MMLRFLNVVVAAILSVSLWAAGHMVSKVMNNGVLYWLYPLYNRLMMWSVDVEDWAGVSIMWGMGE